MRIAELTALTVEPTGADHHQRVARASGVLNFAALIASAVGLPDLAADLCWRHYQIFAEARSLDQDIAVMALMPVVNIARLLIRVGSSNAAYQVLQQLYRAARQRGTTVIADHEVDLSTLIRTDADHRQICTKLWVTLLTDGARALARDGRWSEAAETMAAHRGIGNRLLDGRQIMIMSLMEQGLTEQATAMIESSVPAEPWENTVAALLRIYCRPKTSPPPQRELDHAMQETLVLITQPEPATAAFRARVGLTAFDLTAVQPTPYDAQLRAAVIEVASCDAYAARDVLAHHLMRSQMSHRQEQQLAAVLAAAGLGARELSPAHKEALTTAVQTAEDRLRTLLGTKSRRSSVSVVGDRRSGPRLHSGKTTGGQPCGDLNRHAEPPTSPRQTIDAARPAKEGTVPHGK